MNLWGKMLSNISDAFFGPQLDDDELLTQIKSAMSEYDSIWTVQSQDFIDPEVASQFRNSWRNTYETAYYKSIGIRFSLGLTGNKIKDQIKEFIQIYNDFPAFIKTHNEEIVQKRIASAESLVLPIEGKRLDHQQMQCIVKRAHNHLILAGAGTGKTTTIIGYVKYLIKSSICLPEEILVLSFTNASAAEMSTRLSNELGKQIHASTFHKLGMDIISQVQGKKPGIYSSDIRQYVRKRLSELTQSPIYLQKLSHYLIYGISAQKSEFAFQTVEEYQNYLKYNPPITLHKEKVKSYGEVDIANFLAQNGISYEYEPAYPVDTRTSQYGQYHPDFYLPNYDVYIEYFGINRNGEVPPYFSCKDGKTPTQTYQEGIQWKRSLHNNNKTRLIEVYAYEKLEEHLLEELKNRLSKAGVTFTPLSPDKIWAEIEGSDAQKLDRVTELFGTIITLTKSNHCSISEIRQRNWQYLHLQSINDVLDLVEPVFDSYQQMLADTSQIDFNDMINSATEYVESNSYRHPYRYVIVDEYQDISQARYRLLAALRNQKDYNLFCVGDDWQSIYRFSGSDIGFILNFEKYWGSSEISRIETTYRFSQSLINVSSSFVMQNPEQNRKFLHSAYSVNHFSLEKITGYTEKYAVSFMADKLRELPQNSSVLLIGRYRFDLKMIDCNNLFSYKYNVAEGKTEVIFSKRSDMKINFMTAHSAKGLQADYVFLLNNKANGMGFPSQIADAPVLQLLLDNCDRFLFAEERRLFYVAITRARKKVWLVTIKDNESIFVKELEHAFGNEMRQEQYTCPQCGGKLIRRSGPYGDFFGCANYKINGCRYIRKIAGANHSSTNTSSSVNQPNKSKI